MKQVMGFRIFIMKEGVDGADGWMCHTCYSYWWSTCGANNGQYFYFSILYLSLKWVSETLKWSQGNCNNNINLLIFSNKWYNIIHNCKSIQENNAYKECMYVSSWRKRKGIYQGLKRRYWVRLGVWFFQNPGDSFSS